MMSSTSQNNKISQCTFCLFQILILLNRLKIADARAEYGEMNITKLNQRIDDVEDEIFREKLKIKKVSDELSETFDDMLEHY